MNLKISYLRNESWDKISREERYFTAWLYFEFSKNLKPFFDLLSEKKIIKDSGDYVRYHAAYEVCFYRDLLKYYGVPIKKSALPQKRTFDLALFSEENIIIIEAKANQPFTEKQLVSFVDDKKNIEKLFKIIEKPHPEIKLFAIHSNIYNPKETTKWDFDGCISWLELSKKYADSAEIFKHANSTYRDK